VRRLLPALLAVALLVPASAEAAQRRVPQGFFGVMADGVLLDRTDAQLAHEFDVMQANGVESVRIVVYWAELQPHPAGSPLPDGWRLGRGDVPTTFAPTDRLFEQAARHGMSVLPVILRSPGWAAENPRLYTSPPKADSTYTNFLGTLIDRYGPHGTFWSEHPDVPLRAQRDWQIWNEPNIDRYWGSPHPFAKRYAQLLRASYKAIKAADPGARVVLTGFANFSWRALAAAYRAGIRGNFDLAAVHPFSGHLKYVLKIVRLNREVMARNGDAGKDIAISELTWPSAKGKTKNTVGFETTEHGQALRLRNAFNALLRVRRREHIERITWSTWLTPDRDSPNSFDWSGLRKLDPSHPSGEPIDKPALAAYRAIALHMEGRR
jgi:arabinogalactan endo-1,4-beta-galactosidase